MTFAASIRNCFQNYAFSAGRAGRAEYWYFFLFMVVVHSCARATDHWGHFQTYGAAGPVTFVLGLALALPSIAVQIRRLHDLDTSWRWGLLVLIPIIGVIALLIMSARRGTPGDNRFGPESADESPQESLSPV